VDKLVLKKDIHTLSKNEHLEILRLLAKNSVKYTENNNGIWFNLKSLPNELVEKIFVFVKNCKKIKLELDTLKQLNLQNKKILEEKLTHKKELIINNENHKDLDTNYNAYELEKEPQNQYILNSDKNSLKMKKFPNLTTRKSKLDGTKARVMKKCKEINTITYSVNETPKKEPVVYVSDSELSYS
tara:strand:- start:440 stop:994 length:555 start_codon:yes stop_codon:yes gene_type:complete